MLAAMSMLEISGLSKRYGETVALHDVTLRMESGSIHAVLGENGERGDRPLVFA